MSKTPIQLSITKSFLLLIALLIAICSIFTLIDAVCYPYLVDYYYDDLYINKSHTIPIVYTSVTIGTFLICLSTVAAIHFCATQYPVIHTAVFSITVPIMILIFFTNNMSRYNPTDYELDYKIMIKDYRISAVLYIFDNETTLGKGKHRETLHTFTNNIDMIQKKFKCCGATSIEDWTKEWDNYIAPSCCRHPKSKVDQRWLKIFKIPANVTNLSLEYCDEEQVFKTNCTKALVEEEESRFYNLSWFTGVTTGLIIANTIGSLLLFALSKSQRLDSAEHSDFVMTNLNPRRSLPEITGIKSRASVVDGNFFTVNTSSLMNNGIIESSEPRTQNIPRKSIVHFNLNNRSSIPRPSIPSLASKFSAAARRDSLA